MIRNPCGEGSGAKHHHTDHTRHLANLARISAAFHLKRQRRLRFLKKLIEKEAAKQGQHAAEFTVDDFS